MKDPPHKYWNSKVHLRQVKSMGKIGCKLECRRLPSWCRDAGMQFCGANGSAKDRRTNPRYKYHQQWRIGDRGWPHCEARAH